MKRACFATLRNINPAELPIHPFLAPRVFKPWPTCSNPRFHLKTTHIRQYTRPTQNENDTKNDEEDNAVGGSRDRPVPTGAYVEDLVEAFGDDGNLSETYGPISNHQHNASQESQEMMLDEWGEEEDSFNKTTSVIKNNGFLRHPSSDSRLAPANSSKSLQTEPAQRRTSYSRSLDDPINKSLSKRDRREWQKKALLAMRSRNLNQFQHEWAIRFYEVTIGLEPGLQRPVNIGQTDVFEGAENLGKFLFEFGGRQTSQVFLLWHKCVKALPDTIPFLLCLLRDTPSEAVQTLFSRRTPFFFKLLEFRKRKEPPYRYDQFKSRHLADVLDLVVAYFYQTGSGGPAVFNEIYSLVVKALQDYKGIRDKVNGLTVFTLIKNCNVEQVSALYDMISTQDLLCSHNTRLSFAHFFGLNSQYKRTFEVLKNTTYYGANPIGTPFQTIATLALRRSMLCENGYRDNPSIIAAILDIGIPMNIWHYTVVILNAIEAGDYSMALRTYNLLKDNGTKLNAWTYNVMLKGCISSLDADTFRMVYQDTLESRFLSSDDFLVNSLLAALYIFLLKKQVTDHKAMFNEIVQCYCEYFDPAPLASLKILPMSIGTTKKNLRKATPFAVGLMLRAFVRVHASGRNFDSFMLEKTYRTFRKLVEEGHEEITPLVESTYVPNAFVYAFGKSPNHLKTCLDIMSDMTTSLPPTIIHPDTRQPIRPAPPDVDSWSVLTYSFSRHGQTTAAERVLEIMQERGVQPNVVTWNSLTLGYSKYQDVTGLFDALLRMEAGGVKMDDRSLKVLERVHDKQTLMTYLDRAPRFFSHEEGSSKMNEDHPEDTMGEIPRVEISGLADMLQYNQSQLAM